MLYDIFFQIFSFIIILTIIVFVHEYGHYIIARISGVRITDFSIGFGKKLFGKKDKHGTEWKISMLPLGGYVKMFGDIDPSSNVVDQKIKDSEKHLTFYAKSLPIKSAIVFAGPFFNFLFAIIILSGFFFSFGSIQSSNEITHVAKNSRAEKGGILIGDKIIAIDDYNISSLNEAQKFILSHPEIPLKFTINRNDKIIVKTIKPEGVSLTQDNSNSDKIGRLGVASNKGEYVRLNLGSSIIKAIDETYQICYITLKAIGQMITGDRGSEGVGGPIKIAKMAGETAKMGIYPILWFMAMLSINLGLINLLPIPLLDGGHLLFYIVEALFGKKVASKAQEVGTKIGFALLITLTIYVIINDIRQF